MTLAEKFEIPPENIEGHFKVLGRIGRLGASLESGFLRASWSNEESEAMDYIRQVGQMHGMQTAFDGIGNLYLTTTRRKAWADPGWLAPGHGADGRNL